MFHFHYIYKLKTYNLGDTCIFTNHFNSILIYLRFEDTIDSVAKDAGPLNYTLVSRVINYNRIFLIHQEK